MRKCIFCDEYNYLLDFLIENGVFEQQRFYENDVLSIHENDVIEYKISRNVVLVRRF